MSYADIRKASRKTSGCNRYATGGAVKGKQPGTVINVIQQPPAPAAGPAMPPPMPAPMPAGPPAGGVPPIAGNAALGAMGAPPALKTGGRVMTAGAGSGPGRLQKGRKA